MSGWSSSTIGRGPVRIHLAGQRSFAERGGGRPARRPGPQRRILNSRWTAGPACDPVALAPGGRQRSTRAKAPHPLLPGGERRSHRGVRTCWSPQARHYRLPALVLVDLRLDRGFRLGRGTLVTALDVFNLLNRHHIGDRDVELPSRPPREIYARGWLAWGWSGGSRLSWGCFVAPQTARYAGVNPAPLAAVACDRASSDPRPPPLRGSESRSARRCCL